MIRVEDLDSTIWCEKFVSHFISINLSAYDSQTMRGRKIYKQQFFIYWFFVGFSSFCWWWLEGKVESPFLLTIFGSSRRAPTKNLFSFFAACLVSWAWNAYSSEERGEIYHEAMHLTPLCFNKRVHSLLLLLIKLSRSCLLMSWSTSLV